MFVNNKYSRWYYNIVENFQNKKINGYVEKHHIIPKSLGGTDEKNNLVSLSAKAHFICHLLLTKMTIGPAKFKMIKAAYCLAIRKGPGQQRYKVNSRSYHLLKIQLANTEVPISTRLKISQAQKKRYKNMPGTFFGKTHTEESKQKMRKPKSEEFIRNMSIARKGKPTGRIPHNKGKTYEELYGINKANELRKKVAKVGIKNGFFGKQHSKEQREKKRQEKLLAIKKVCYYCNKTIDPMNYARWHGEKCNEKK